MSEPDRIRLGLIGFGVGKIYAGVFRSVSNYYAGEPPVELVAVGTASEASGERARRLFGFQWISQDYRTIVHSPEVNTLVIATPNHLHASILAEALPTGKAIYIDKPLTIRLDQALSLLRLAREVGNNAQMIFEMRFCPALQMARQLIDDGRLGEVYSFRAHYYRSSYADPAKPLRWKRSLELSGSGALGDLAAHLIDLVSWLVGQPAKVSAQLRTFIRQRPETAGGPMVAVETDDHAILGLSMPGGAVGTIEAGRLITGAINDMQLEIYGSRGSLRWNLQDGNYLYLADQRMPENERGWLQIATNSRYPGVYSVGADVPTGMVRYHIASAADFIQRSVQGRSYDPDLYQGVRVQAVIEAAIGAHRQNTWVDVPAVE